MNQLTLNPAQNNHKAACGDQMTLAARELTAFFRTVTESFGSEQAKISAEDWLHELTSIPVLPDSARQWRSLTINAAARLARRVHVSPNAHKPCHSERLHREVSASQRGF